MAVIKSSVKLILKNARVYSYSGAVLALGRPEIYATLGELREWFPALTGREFPLSTIPLRLSANPVGAKLGWVSAETFLHALGLARIVSLDLPGGEYNPDRVHDLNHPVPIEFWDQFDMVLDPGTIEHVFDIKTALSNVVHALRVGGTIIHQVPVYSYNGGYYSINPNVLNDFYALNGFEDLRTYIVMWDRYRPHTGRNRCYSYSGISLRRRHALSDFDQCRYTPHVLFFARKTAELSTINVPLQFSGEYFAAMADNPHVDNDTVINMAAIKRLQWIVNRLLPRESAYYLGAIARRFLNLYETRRSSFWM